jgi:hypothetical protein
LVFVHSNCLRYLLGAQREDLFFAPGLGAVCFDMSGVSAEVAGVKPSTGSGAGAVVMPVAGFAASFRCI